MVSDGEAYVDFLLAQKGVKPGKVGVVGYCFTGQMAVRIAAAVPDKIAAAASFHGGFLVTDKPDSPHTDSAADQGAALFRPCGGGFHRHAGTDRDAGSRRCATGTAPFRAKSMKAPSTVGLCRAGRFYNELQAERAFEEGSRTVRLRTLSK